MKKKQSDIYHAVTFSLKLNSTPLLHPTFQQKRTYISTATKPDSKFSSNQTPTPNHNLNPKRKRQSNKYLIYDPQSFIQNVLRPSKLTTLSPNVMCPPHCKMKPLHCQWQHCITNYWLYTIYSYYTSLDFCFIIPLYCDWTDNYTAKLYQFAQDHT